MAVFSPDNDHLAAHQICAVLNEIPVSVKLFNGLIKQLVPSGPLDQVLGTIVVRFQQAETDKQRKSISRLFSQASKAYLESEGEDVTLQMLDLTRNYSGGPIRIKRDPKTKIYTLHLNVK